MPDTPPDFPDSPEYLGNGDDDLAALNFGAAGEAVGDTDLGVILGDYGYPNSAGGTEPPAMPMFTVANPPGTVTVTTYMDGRVQQVDLSPKTESLSESALADEIVVIAGLATQDAKSAQYTFMLDGMKDQGHDNVATRDFLNRDLNLPTPEQALAARAELFTTRYAGEE